MGTSEEEGKWVGIGNKESLKMITIVFQIKLGGKDIIVHYSI